MTIEKTARVAKAIWEVTHPNPPGWVAWENCREGAGPTAYEREWTLKEARAAIEAMRSPEADAEQRVIREALSFDVCMSEFEGDLAPCGEHLDALYTACDALRKVRNAAFATP